MDKDNDNNIVQDDDSVHPPSDILDIDSLSSEYDTSSGAITDNDATEDDFHTQSVPRNMRSDSGTGVPSFEPSSKG